MRFVSGDGIPIYVGKNNRQNDALTLQTARSENIWLHAKNIPGSHVIIDYEGEPPETTLREAANLAAFYSQSRTSTGVPVDYTPRKYVKKPSGSRPGMVIYSTNRTLYVTPDAALVQRLKENAGQT
jgi:predicted ribosome quality control (RQC) complex YloA/Tae2 family protein